MLNDELKDIEPGAGLHDKVREGIARNVVRMRRRNTAFGAVAIAIIITMALSTAMPVFGRNGTLPQVIAAMAAERQAEKMSRTLGTGPVEQTGTALQTSVATVQAVSDSALSETDGILALVIAERSGTSVAEVLKMRTGGQGWGRIMAQLDVSGRDIGEAMSQAETTAVASSPSAASQGQGATSKPGVSNSNGDKIVVNGEITAVSTTLITVAGKTFVIAPETQLKYHGKAITPAGILAKLPAGKLYATVQGTKQTDTTLRAALIIVQDGADVQDTPSDEDTSQQATPSNEQTNPSNERAAVSNEQQKRGKVTVVTATVLHIDGFAHDIVLNADTKVEQVGAGSTNIAAIKVGQTVQVHVMVSGTTYTARQVHIEDKYVKADTTTDEDEPTDPSIKTWQGTISSVFVQPGVNSASEQTIGVVVLTVSGQQPTIYWVLPTSVLQDASHHTLTLAALQTVQGTAVQKVTIQGRLLADGTTVDVVKLTVTTGSTTTTPEPKNPGKGNGKH
jgi:hypothetical protein